MSRARISVFISSQSVDREPPAHRLPVQYYVPYTDSYYDTADVRIGRPLMTKSLIMLALIFSRVCALTFVLFCFILFHFVEITKNASAVALYQYIIALQLGHWDFRPRRIRGKYSSAGAWLLLFTLFVGP